MDKIETYRGFEIRAFEREEGRWRADIRKADGSMLKILVGDSGHRTRPCRSRRGQDAD
jgi:hypothetical protein